MYGYFKIKDRYRVFAGSKKRESNSASRSISRLSLRILISVISSEANM